MFSLGTLKPLLSALVLPPGGLALLLLLAYLLARKLQRIAWTLVLLCGVTLWTLSCDATAYALNHWLLISYPAFNNQQQAQAIVVLGGGVDSFAPEYGEETLTDAGYKRLAYAAYLAKRTQLPVLYAGGKGWAASSAQINSEADVASLSMTRDFGLSLQWLDNTSRDTRENALNAYSVLSPLNKKRILLVTHDWHMQRSMRNFEQAGFEVIPAPMGYLQPPASLSVDYLPTANGLRHSFWVLREWLGLKFT